MFVGTGSALSDSDSLNTILRFLLSTEAYRLDVDCFAGYFSTCFSLAELDEAVFFEPFDEDPLFLISFALLRVFGVDKTITGSSSDDEFATTFFALEEEREDRDCFSKALDFVFCGICLLYIIIYLKLFSLFLLMVHLWKLRISLLIDCLPGYPCYNVWEYINNNIERFFFDLGCSANFLI